MRLFHPAFRANLREPKQGKPLWDLGFVEGFHHPFPYPDPAFNGVCISYLWKRISR